MSCGVGQTGGRQRRTLCGPLSTLGRPPGSSRATGWPRWNIGGKSVGSDTTPTRTSWASRIPTASGLVAQREPVKYTLLTNSSEGDGSGGRAGRDVVVCMRVCDGMGGRVGGRNAKSSILPIGLRGRIGKHGRNACRITRPLAHFVFSQRKARHSSQPGSGAKKKPFLYIKGHGDKNRILVK